jgi:hypothetical protein
MVLIVDTKDTDEYQVQTVRTERTVDEKDEIRQKPLAKMDLSRIEEENLLQLALNDVVH